MANSNKPVMTCGLVVWQLVWLVLLFMTMRAAHVPDLAWVLYWMYVVHVMAELE